MRPEVKQRHSQPMCPAFHGSQPLCQACNTPADFGPAKASMPHTAMFTALSLPVLSH